MQRAFRKTNPQMNSSRSRGNIQGEGQVPGFSSQGWWCCSFKWGTPGEGADKGGKRGTGDCELAELNKPLGLPSDVAP